MSQDGDGNIFPPPSVPPGQGGQQAEDELETEAARGPPLVERRHARNRKRLEVEFGQLQVQAMQDTLQELVHAQRPLGCMT
ncbi:hypothetical protein ABVT39_002397 [Epinephelus coioides]